MKTQNKLEILGREGFLNVNSPVNYGTRTLYTPGLDNLSNRSVYKGLIKDLNERNKNNNNRRKP